MHEALRRLLFVLLLIALPSMAWTQQTTGSISGGVFDQNGSPITGATVRVSGEPLPGGRTTTTSDIGLYAFSLLLPGMYTVEVTSAQGTSKRTALVEIGRDTQTDLVLGLTVEEAIDVTASTPVVDIRSSEVAFNFKQEQLQHLPLERSYRGLFQLIPGVADNRSTVGPSAGGTRQDNQYLIDGVNITNPSFGYLSTEVNELDIAEVNIKRAGISAEFGRVGGAVTNAVSRSGTNRIMGVARMDWLPKGLVAEERDLAFRDSLLSTVVSPAIGIGGPFIRDHLFWYGSARWFQENKWDRKNKLGDPLPEEEREGHELYGKITSVPTMRHLINVSFRDRPNDVRNDSLTSETRAEVATDRDNSSRVATASWGFFVSDRSSLDVKYLYMKENNTEIPQVDLGQLPAPFNVSALTSMGRYRDPLLQNVWTGGAEFTNRQNYRRHEVRGTFTQFLDLGRTSHELKGGAGYEFGEENLHRITNGWGEIINTGTQFRVRYYPEQPPQLGQGRTWSLFVQDNITIGQRLTVNAGLLANRDEFAQELEGSEGCGNIVTALNLLQGGPAVFESTGDRCTFLRFNYGDELQPRIGVNFNVRDGKGDKAYANWGRYYNLDQKSSGRSLAPRRIFQREAIYTLAGVLVSDNPRASTSTKRIDPKLEPIYNDEFLVGYATPLLDNWSVDVFFMYRTTDNFIEDVPSVLPTSGPFVAANLPCDDFQGCIGADAKRSFKAFTVDVSRRLDDRWSANISYTWSRFVGNFDLDYATVSVFNTSSIIQDGPGTFVQDPNRYGPLRQDRPHVFKVFSTWMPMEALSLGGYFRVQSGTPWNARGQDRAGSSALNYLEPAGTNRNPVWANLDLLASYRLRLTGRASVTLTGRVLNVAGNQTRLSTDSIQFLDTPSISVPPFIGTYTTPNAFFGTANGYAPPRRLVLGATVNF